jgi:hypothetical protein
MQRITSSLLLDLVLLALVLAGTLGRACAGGPPIEEYQVKAAFLFNFAKFVEWPAEAFKAADQPLAICVLGQNPFGSSLDQAVEGKVLRNRKFVVLEITNTPPAGKCHILFVSSSERKRSRRVLEDVKTCCVLTVGETEEFIASGGMINLKLKDERVHLEIDPEAAERAGLRISSKLLSLAEIVKK